MCDELLASRNAYAYPAVGLEEIGGEPQHRDFDSLYAMDEYHTALLHSGQSHEKMLGYLSVVYWGFFSGQDGVPRPERAIGKVNLAVAADFGIDQTAEVIDAAIAHQQEERFGAALMGLTALPQLGFAFAAKVCAFLDPGDCGVADSVIAENYPEFSFAMNDKGIVRTNRANAASYDEFCGYLQQRRDQINSRGMGYRWTDRDGQLRAWRAIDVERALFAP